MRYAASLMSEKGESEEGKIMLRVRCSLLVMIAALIPVTSVFAGEVDPAKVAWLRGEDWGPAFSVLGEYSGTIRTDDGELKLGVQVIAEGGEKLSWSAYIGGLPGDGGDGNMVIRGAGELQGSIAVLKGETGRGEAKDGNLTIYTTDNRRIGELPKVSRVSPTMGRKPPEGALVLFDGTTADHFENGKVTEEGWLMQGVTSREKFQSCELHLEFQTSFMPNARGQGRSNSGCYLQGRYEVQMLDSFGLTGEHNECGGIYEIQKPSVNMCLPPLSWQTYDIEFRAAAFEPSGAKQADALITVRHNGVLIHDKVKLPRATRAAPVKEGPEPGPIYLQDHGNPVRYRNIWVKVISPS